MKTYYERDNEAFYLAKQELYPDAAVSELTLTELSEIIQRATKIAAAMKGDS